MTSFPQRLEFLRIKNHISQKELSEKVGISRTVIGMYESGKTDPSASRLIWIASYFNVSVDYLLGLSDWEH